MKTIARCMKCKSLVLKPRQKLKLLLKQKLKLFIHTGSDSQWRGNQRVLKVNNLQLQENNETLFSTLRRINEATADDRILVIDLW